MKKIAVLAITVFVMSLFSIASAHTYQQGTVVNYQMASGDEKPPAEQGPQNPSDDHQKPKKKKPEKKPEPAPLPGPVSQ